MKFNIIDPPASALHSTASVSRYPNCSFSPSGRTLGFREFNELPYSNYRHKFGTGPTGTSKASVYRQVLDNDSEKRNRDLANEPTVYTGASMKYPIPRFKGTNKGSE